MKLYLPKQIHSTTTALLMWVTSILLQLMAGIGLVHAGIQIVWASPQAAGFHPIVSSILASLALVELAWMSATWAMEHTLRLAFLLDVCLIFIAREVIDRMYSGQITVHETLLIGGLFLAVLGGRWLISKVYRLD